MESFETAAPIIVLVCSLTALLFSFIKFYSVKRKSEGTDMMKSISVKIRKGAMAYLKRQYKTVGIFFAIMFFILTVLAAKRFLSPFVPFAFLTGGFFSGLSGYVGMNIATYANTRTANGVRDGLNKGLKIAFASGSVMGLTVVGLGLFDISVWFILLKFVFHDFFFNIFFRKNYSFNKFFNRTINFIKFRIFISTLFYIIFIIFINFVSFRKK